MNPYLELGITPNATFDELKQAYRQAVFRYHPDSAYGAGNPEKFNAVLQAYEALKPKHQALQPLPKAKPQRPSCASPSIDAITLKMSVEHLIYNLENSENFHVRWAALHTLVLKNTPRATAYLLDYLHHIEPASQCHLIRLMGETKLVQAEAGLFSWIFSPHPEVAFETIKSLETIASPNRTKIVQCLKKERSYWNAWVGSVQKVAQGLRWGHNRKILGKILLKHQRISSEQLQIALWLQKKHELRLGTTLTKLGYTSPNEIQQALRLQKN